MSFSEYQKPAEHACLIPAAAVPVVSWPPLFFKSEPGEKHPVRDFDLLGIPDFYDHSGNFLDGVMIAGAVIYGGVAINYWINSDPDTLKSGTIATTAAVAVVGINAAYESGVLPLVKKEDTSVDVGDALFGGLTGLLMSATFCISALRRQKLRSRQADPSA